MPFRDRTLEQLGDLLRSPDAYVGGAAAAAAAASLAASTAALVTTLSARRRRNSDRRAKIEHDTGRLHELQRQLLVAGEDDERALDALMRLYGSRSNVEDTTALGAALASAAESAIEIARLAGEVCELTARQVGHASRFTVSDLGAAAAIARGAVTAALLTAEINVRMLAEMSGFPTGRVDRLTRSITGIETASSENARAAVEGTRERVSLGKGESAS